MSVMSLNVRISGPLSDHVARKVGDEGSYENVSEYVRDLIRREAEQEEAEALARLRAELQRAFATPDEDYVEWDVDAFLADAKRRNA